MGYDHAEGANRRRAAELLAALTGRVPFDEGALGATLEERASTTSAHWRLSKVVGVHLHNSAEGWCADLEFEGLPTGIPAIIRGTPFLLRVDAVNQAIGELRLCHARERRPLPLADAHELWFRFDGLDVRVEPAHLPALAGSPLDPEEKVEIAKSRLAYLRNVICADEPMTGARLGATASKVQSAVRMICAYAFAQGLRQFTLADGVWADYVPSPGLRH